MLDKSKMNQETAEWAVKQRYFDVATSRYYYSIYQKIIHISKKLNFYEEPPYGEDSHKYTLDLFRKNIRKKVEKKDITWIEYIKKLKEHRVQADYRPDRIDSQSLFNLTIKVPFVSINNVLDKL